jgi:hypothetical protein
MLEGLWKTEIGLSVNAGVAPAIAACRAPTGLKPGIGSARLMQTITNRREMRITGFFMIRERTIQPSFRQVLGMQKGCESL